MFNRNGLFVGSYAAFQALGKYDVYPKHDDHGNNWAPAPQSGHEYIAVSLAYRVVA